MAGIRIAWAGAIALVTTFAAGCASGPFSSDCTSCQTCSEVACLECGCTDGGCGCQPPDRWSKEWYALKAQEPVGERQRCYKGKVWPMRPRPTGPRQQFAHRYHAAHHWPLPYICQDRAYVAQVVNTQVANGWIEETTLYDYHFDADTNELTFAGRNHLSWILREAPVKRRVAFVQTAWDAAVTDSRMASVRMAAHEIVGETNCPPIVPRDATPNGTPAEYVDSIHRAVRDTIPEPRIQYNPNPTGISGSN